jgi:hypothetical protein
MLDLRSASPADIPFVMETERLPGYLPILGRWEETKHRTAMADPANAYLIGEIDGKLEGFAILQHLDDPMGNVLLRDFGAQFRCGPHSAPDAGVQAMRSDTGMPRWVMMLMTLQPMATSVLCFGRVRAWRLRPITVL